MDRGIDQARERYMYKLPFQSKLKTLLDLAEVWSIVSVVAKRVLKESPQRLNINKRQQIKKDFNSY